MPIPIHSPRSLVPPPSASAGPDGRLLITLNQAASVLSVSKRTLERLIASGIFPTPLKIGRSSRVSSDDIANYLEELRRQRGDKLDTS